MWPRTRTLITHRRNINEDALRRMRRFGLAVLITQTLVGAAVEVPVGLVTGSFLVGVFSACGAIGVFIVATTFAAFALERYGRIPDFIARPTRHSAPGAPKPRDTV